MLADLGWLYMKCKEIAKKGNPEISDGQDAVYCVMVQYFYANSTANQQKDPWTRLSHTIWSPSLVGS